MQMGAEIRMSIADVDSDLLLSRYWPPTTSVRRGSYSETDCATTDQKARTWTQKYVQTRTESVKCMFFPKSLATSRTHNDPFPFADVKCKVGWKILRSSNVRDGDLQFGYFKQCRLAI